MATQTRLAKINTYLHTKDSHWSDGLVESIEDTRLKHENRVWLTRYIIRRQQIRRRGVAAEIAYKLRLYSCTNSALHLILAGHFLWGWQHQKGPTTNKFSARLCKELRSIIKVFIC